MGDPRDEITWLVLELTSLGESAMEEGNLEGVLRAVLGFPLGHPIFIPRTSYIYQGTSISFTALEGYVFVASGLSADLVQEIESLPYIRKALSRGKGYHRTFSTVADSHVRDLRRSLNEMVGAELEEGMEVKVIDGPLLGIVGEIVGIYEDHVSVLVEMRSIKAIQNFPSFFLHPIGDL